MRFKVGWRAFWVQLGILTTEVIRETLKDKNFQKKWRDKISEQLNDEEFKQRMRDSIETGIRQGLEEFRQSRQSGETGSDKTDPEATDSADEQVGDGPPRPEPPKQPE